MPEPGFHAACAALADLGDRRLALRAAYEFVSSRYQSRRFWNVAHFWRVCDVDLARNWREKGCVILCTEMNLVLEALLLGSGLFDAWSIRRAWSLVWFLFPHQYVQVEVAPGEWIDVDCWARDFDIPFGSYAGWWHSGTMRGHRS